MSFFKKTSKEEKKKRKEEKKKKRQERKSKRKEKRKKRRAKRKEKFQMLKLKAIAPFMRLLVKRKGQSTKSDLKELANQVYQLYLKKHFEEDNIVGGYSLSEDAVNHMIPPELIKVVIDFVVEFIKKKKEHGTTGDKEMDAELEKVEEKLSEIKDDVKDKEYKEEKESGFGNLIVYVIIGAVIIISIKFLIKKSSK